MKRRELELAVRAAARLSREREFFLIGSQAVHACSRRLPAEVLLSQECDLYPRNLVQTANLLHAELGRGSRFARKHGFYVDVVAPELASLPDGWEKRLRALKVGNTTVHCLDVHDLLVSKLAAGRLKDLEFVGAILKRGIAKAALVRRRINQFPIKRERTRLRAQLAIVLQNVR